MSESAITITNLTKRFDDVTAIENLSLDIGWGELFGVLGPNGAGKSTTVNILGTLLKPTAGSATVDGHDVEFDPEGVREVIGVCPQEPAFYRFLTGEENIILMGEMHLVSRDVLKERVSGFERKWRMSFEEFARQCKQGTLSADPYSWDAERSGTSGNGNRR